jgi:Undecaprenyl-phosphate galactose phosphotransferase WbaP
MPDRRVFSSLWVRAQDVGGMLGLEVRQQLLLRGPRTLKAAMDLVGAGLLVVILLPVFLLIALLVKIDSPGPVFYGATRLGQNGTLFRTWKFRTMHREAEKMLQQYLADNPELREEWQRTFKLKNDPRITRVGKFLRLMSLDELPQLWNVLVGEMSLVGPRPIVEGEIKYYGESYDLYKRVRPGISGLWQVSGRNDTTYEERVRLDTYYVRNWSPWLDFYVALKTVQAVLARRGAY